MVNHAARQSAGWSLRAPLTDYWSPVTEHCAPPPCRLPSHSLNSSVRRAVPSGGSKPHQRGPDREKRYAGWRRQAGGKRTRRNCNYVRTDTISPSVTGSENMIDWLVTNKEWMFSGIGVTVLMGLWSIAISIKRKRATISPKINSQLLSNHAQDVHEHAAPKVRAIPTKHTIGDLVLQTKGLPLYQSDRMMKELVGVRLKCEGYIFSVSRGTANSITVSFRERSWTDGFIMAELDLHSNPDLLFVKENAFIAVEGTIVRIASDYAAVGDVNVIDIQPVGRAQGLDSRH